MKYYYYNIYDYRMLFSNTVSGYAERNKITMRRQSKRENLNMNKKW